MKLKENWNKISEFSEQELILLLTNKDNKGFINLINCYSSYIIKKGIRPYIYDNSIHEDIFQEVLVKIFLNIEIYNRNNGSLVSWIIAIAKNTSIDFNRNKLNKKVKRTDLFESIEQFDLVEEDYVEGNVIRDDTIQFLLSLLKNTTEERANIIRKTVFEELSGKELSIETGVNENTNKGKKRLGIFDIRRFLLQPENILIMKEAKELL